MRGKKEETKCEEQDKKEAPIQKYDSQREMPAEQERESYCLQGKPTTDKDYTQPRALTVNAIYMMLDPREMYVHNDPNLAMRNYVRMPSSAFDHYKTERKAA